MIRLFYCFDGRLVAEYNEAGICTRDYIYMGGKLIAEYRPLEAKYYYYATDQIGSTRIVTDDTGGVVYAAAHDPYGGIQKTWVSAYDPSLKFSGKERDTESGLDYFGARYYDHSLYRFLSVDPVIPAGRAVSKPQRWNLYAYCGNNPVNYVDPDGAFPVRFTLTRMGISPRGGIWGSFIVETPYGSMTGYTLEPHYLGDTRAQTGNSGSAIMCGTYTGTLVYDRLLKNGDIIDTIELFGPNLGTRTGILIHNGNTEDDTSGCILVGFSWSRELGFLTIGARQRIVDLIEGAKAVDMDFDIFEVLLGFELLPSMADFPEITVEIKMTTAFFATWIALSVASMFPAI